MYEKITEIVEQYIQDKPEDYRAVCDYVASQRKKLADDKHGQGEGGYSALYEVPAELHEILTKALDPEEKQEFSRLEHKKWFANKFPEFKLPDEV